MKSLPDLASVVDSHLLATRIMIKFLTMSVMKMMLMIYPHFLKI